jgi:hypothetical protein
MKTIALPAQRQFRRPLTSACFIGFGALAALACSGGDVEDLGATDPAAASQNLEQPPAPDVAFYSSPLEFRGRWIGEADDVFAFGLLPGEPPPTYTFPSGARRIVLDLLASDDPSGSFPRVTGTITFGDGEPPPPPTDPDVGYPVDVSYLDLLAYDPDATPPDILYDASPLPPLEGFSYSISEIAFSDTPPAQAVQDGLLQLAYESGEYLQPWCELQTPVPDGQGGYACIEPSRGLSFNEGVCAVPYEDGRVDVVNCDKLFLCGAGQPPNNGRCACDSTGCFRNYLTPVFDDTGILSLRRSGDELVGIITEGWFLNARGRRVPLGAIHFRRAE